MLMCRKQTDLLTAGITLGFIYLFILCITENMMHILKDIAINITFEGVYFIVGKIN